MTIMTNNMIVSTSVFNHDANKARLTINKVIFELVRKISYKKAWFKTIANDL